MLRKGKSIKQGQELDNFLEKNRGTILIIIAIPDVNRITLTSYNKIRRISWLADWLNFCFSTFVTLSVLSVCASLPNCPCHYTSVSVSLCTCGTDLQRLLKDVAIHRKSLCLNSFVEEICHSNQMDLSKTKSLFQFFIITVCHNLSLLTSISLGSYE